MTIVSFFTWAGIGVFSAALAIVSLVGALGWPH
jgi:hypothetical protein